MDIFEHKKKFDDIVLKYGLFDEGRAEKISKYLVSIGRVNALEFAQEFGMDVGDAEIFLKFIEKGIRFKSENLDN